MTSSSAIGHVARAVPRWLPGMASCCRDGRQPPRRWTGSSTGPSAATNRQRADSRRRAGSLRRWLFLAGYRQPAAAAVFVAAMLWRWRRPDRCVWSCVRRSGLMPNCRVILATMPAAVGRPAVAARLLGPLDRAADSGAAALAARPPRAAAARGKSRAGPAALPGAAGHAERGGAGLRRGAGARARFAVAAKIARWPASSAPIKPTCWPAGRASSPCAAWRAGWKSPR